MERLPDIVGAQLAKILQKPESEMQFMLKRHSLLNKKNQKKSELDRTQSMINQKIVATLKQQNKKSENDFIELSSLRAESFAFKMPPDLNELVPHFQKDLAEYVRLNNDYVKTKISEEKAKAKKPKINNEEQEKQLASKYESLEATTELNAIVEKLLKNLPEGI